MLDRKDDQHQERADHEGRVEVQRPQAGDCHAQGFPCADGRGQGGNTIAGKKRRNRVIRRGSGIGCQEFHHTRIIRRQRGKVCRHPVQHHLRVGRRDRVQRVQDVACGNHAAQAQHRAPGEPVAPDRQRPDQLGIAQPGRSPVDRRPPGLVLEHAGKFGIGEGLQEAHDHRDDPDDKGRLARDTCDPTHREEHQRRHAGCDPECPFPVQGPDEFARAFVRHHVFSYHLSLRCISACIGRRPFCSGLSGPCFVGAGRPLPLPDAGCTGSPWRKTGRHRY